MRHPLSERFHQLLELCGELHDRKQADYGREGDPFANVRSSEDFGVPGRVGAMTRGNDKMKRIQKAAQQVLSGAGVELENESMENSLFDLAVYCLIAYVLYEESVGELPPDIMEMFEELEGAREEPDDPRDALRESWEEMRRTDEPEFIQFMKYPGPQPKRYVVSTSTRRRSLQEIGMPKEFPLRWMDQADDILRAIQREQLKNMQAPEHVFIPERVEGAKLREPMTIWGVPVEIDDTLDKDEFVVRVYRQHSRMVEFHHYHFSEGPIE